MTRCARCTVAALVAGLAAPGLLPAQVDTVSIDELGRRFEVDSAYSTPALRELVGRAAEAAARLPELLDSYHTEVESELSIVQSEPDGREAVLQLEQVASEMVWRRDRPTVQRVVGYRSRAAGLIPSVLSMMEVPWVVPTLYGDRIDVVRWSAPVRDEDGRLLRRRALHPFAPERGRVYRFTGGDTIVTLNLPDRTIPLVRVYVEPVLLPDRPTLLFDGYLDLDGTRYQIVRMRGRMVSADPEPGLDERLLGAVFRGATFVEFESAEYEERFWLPRYQRIEVQAVSTLTEGRVALRLVSRFDHPDPNDPGPLSGRYPDPPPGGLLVVGDAAAATFDAWEHGLGELTAGANVLDFMDLEPDADRVRSSGRVGFGVRHISELVRLNDAEGVFTGAGIEWHPGRAWREGRVRVHGGWAWKEETARGGIAVAHRPQDSRWELVGRAERVLLTARDFLSAWGREPGVPPLFAAEDDLLYDHRAVGLLARQPRGAGWAWRLEASRGWDAAAGNDEPTAADPSETDPLSSQTTVAEGSYWLGRLTLTRNSGAAGYGVVPGTALRFDAQGGAGSLRWLRLEAGIGIRRLFGDLALEGRLDGGLVLATDPPPQRLLTLGRYSGLPGYGPRAFAGDRAALAQTALAWTLPVLRQPFRLGGVYLPGIAPAPTVVLRAGWADASDDAAPVVDRLGAAPTDGLRGSIGLRLRLFGGGISVGSARPLESGGAWRFVWSLAREF